MEFISICDDREEILKQLMRYPMEPDSVSTRQIPSASPLVPAQAPGASPTLDTRVQKVARSSSPLLEMEWSKKDDGLQYPVFTPKK